MSFISTYIFKAEISKPALIDFIARTPAELFFFLVSSGNHIYGMFLTDEVVEFFTNEFPVKTFEIIEAEDLKKIQVNPGCKIWGNKELLNL